MLNLEQILGATPKSDAETIIVHHGAELLVFIDGDGGDDRPIKLGVHNPKLSARSDQSSTWPILDKLFGREQWQTYLSRTRTAAEKFDMEEHQG